MRKIFSLLVVVMMVLQVVSVSGTAATPSAAPPVVAATVPPLGLDTFVDESPLESVGEETDKLCTKGNDIITSDFAGEPAQNPDSPVPSNCEANYKDLESKWCGANVVNRNIKSCIEKAKQDCVSTDLAKVIVFATAVIKCYTDGIRAQEKYITYGIFDQVTEAVDCYRKNPNWDRQTVEKGPMLSELAKNPNDLKGLLARSPVSWYEGVLDPSQADKIPVCDLKKITANNAAKLISGNKLSNIEPKYFTDDINENLAKAIKQGRIQGEWTSEQNLAMQYAVSQDPPPAPDQGASDDNDDGPSPPRGSNPQAQQGGPDFFQQILLAMIPIFLGKMMEKKEREQKPPKVEPVVVPPEQRASIEEVRRGPIIARGTPVDTPTNALIDCDKLKSDPKKYDECIKQPLNGNVLLEERRGTGAASTEAARSGANSVTASVINSLTGNSIAPSLSDLLPTFGLTGTNADILFSAPDGTPQQPLPWITKADRVDLAYQTLYVKKNFPPKGPVQYTLTKENFGIKNNFLPYPHVELGRSGATTIDIAGKNGETIIDASHDHFFVFPGTTSHEARKWTTNSGVIYMETFILVAPKQPNEQLVELAIETPSSKGNSFAVKQTEACVDITGKGNGVILFGGYDTLLSELEIYSAQVENNRFKGLTEIAFNLNSDTGFDYCLTDGVFQYTLFEYEVKDRNNKVIEKSTGIPGLTDQQEQYIKRIQKGEKKSLASEYLIP